MIQEIDKNKRVVVLQTKDQVRHYAEHKRQENDLIIPIGPAAMYQADKNGWATCNLGSLWTLKDFEQAKFESQSRIDGLIAALNVYSKGINPDLNIEIGSYYAFQLWVIIGHIHYNYFIARSIAKQIKPERLLIYTKDINQPFLDLRPDPDRIFADVLSRSGCFKAENIEIQQICEKRRGNTAKERIINFIPQAMAIRLRELRSRLKIKNLRKATYHLLMVGGAYDWAKISQYEAFRNVFKIHIIPKLMAKESGNPPIELVGILKGSVKQAGNMVYDLKGLASAIHADMLLYAKKNEELKKELKRYDAVVTTVLPFPWDSYLAHMAAKMNIPVIVWQHGEKGQTQDVTALYTELFYASDYLSYSPSVSEIFQSWIGKTRSVNVETVGSLGKNVVWRGGKTIIYATGKWFKTAMPFGEQDPAQDPDHRLFNAHKTILGYLNTVAIERTVIFKANNTSNLNEIPYDYSRIRIDYSTPFTELLKTAGLVILDTPATTLVESCSIKVPIFVLGGRSKYLPDFLERVKRRVVWCDSPKELVMKVDAYLRTGLYEADVDDETYSRNYCATLEPDEVVLRVKKTLMNAIDRSIKK